MVLKLWLQDKHCVKVTFVYFVVVFVQNGANVQFLPHKWHKTLGHQHGGIMSVTNARRTDVLVLQMVLETSDSIQEMMPTGNIPENNSDNDLQHPDFTPLDCSGSFYTQLE